MAFFSHLTMYILFVVVIGSFKVKVKRKHVPLGSDLKPCIKIDETVVYLVTLCNDSHNNVGIIAKS